MTSLATLQTDNSCFLQVTQLMLDESNLSAATKGKMMQYWEDKEEVFSRQRTFEKAKELLNIYLYLSTKVRNDVSRTSIGTKRREKEQAEEERRLASAAVVVS